MMAQSDKPLILHVDDDEDYLYLFRLTFEKFFEIMSVKSAQEAFETLEKEPIEAVIADFDMPGVDGIELLKNLRKKYPVLPIIFKTGQGNEELAREAFLSGGTDYFTKDIHSFAHKERFINSVMNAVEKCRLDLEKAKTEEKLKKTEERYRILSENSFDVIWSMTLDGTYTYVSPSSEKVTGFKPEYYIGKNFSEILLPESVDKASQKLALELSKPPDERPKSIIIELKQKTRDGSILETENSVNLVFDENGEVIGLQGISRDITKRKRAEEELKKTNQILKTINQIAVELASLPAETDLYCYLVKKLKSLTGATVVTIGEYNPKEKMLVQKYLESDSGIISLSRKLGFNPEGARIKINDENYKEMMTKIIGHRKTLHEITMGAVPQTVSSIIQKTLGVDRFIGVAYVFEGVLYGTSVLAFKKDQPDPPLYLLEAFAAIGAVSLRRRKAEEAVKETMEHLSATLRSIGDAVISTDASGRVTGLNKVAETLTGWTSDEALGCPVSEVFNIVNAFTREKIANPVDKVLREGKIVGLANHTMLISKDGSEYQIADSAAPIKTKDDRILGVVLVFRDVTEDYRMREQIKKSEERLQIALNAVNDGLWDWRPDMGTLYWSPKFFSMLGYEKGDVEPSIENWRKLMHPEDLPKADFALTRCVDNETDDYEAEVRFLAKSGMWRWILIRGKVISRNESGEIIRMAGIHTDITDRKRMENELLDKNRELSDFAMRVSHNIKTPLVLIQGFLNAIKEDPALFDQHYDKVFNRITELIFFVENLLRLSRAGRAIDKKEDVRLRHLVEKIFNGLKPDDVEAKLITSCEVPVIKGDPVGIEQVFSSLIQNSIRHEDPDKGKLLIEVSSKSTNGNVLIRYSDNGTGIEQGEAEDIFRKGFTTGERKGSGFGLAIARKIINAHGGKIWAKSLGKKQGIEFFIELPA